MARTSCAPPAPSASTATRRSCWKVSTSSGSPSNQPEFQAQEPPSNRKAGRPQDARPRSNRSAVDEHGSQAVPGLDRALEHLGRTDVRDRDDPRPAAEILEPM